jgi:hypothetical protein
MIPFTIYVKLLTGKIINLDVNAFDTIKLLKFKIRYIINIPTYLQILYFNNVELKDDQLISSYNIQSDNTINLFVKLKTGY